MLPTHGRPNLDAEEGSHCEPRRNCLPNNPYAAPRAYRSCGGLSSRGPSCASRFNGGCRPRVGGGCPDRRIPGPSADHRHRPPHGSRRNSSGLRLSFRERRLCRTRGEFRDPVYRPQCGRHQTDGGQDPRERIRLEAGSTGRAERSAGRQPRTIRRTRGPCWFPAARQGSVRWRRQRHAYRARGGGTRRRRARRSATSEMGECTPSATSSGPAT